MIRALPAAGVTAVLAALWLLVTPVLGLAATAGLVASGLGGNEDYADAFRDQATRISSALRTLDADAESIRYVDAGAVGREALIDAIVAQAERAQDTFVLVLLGHGSADRTGWRFNIRGPDLSGDDLVAALNSVRAARQLIILATSASGALLEVLAQPGRVVITATKSGGEINAVRFPEYLAAALDAGKADIDRNEILTAAEVFRYANEATQRYYREQRLLASEHARLTGDAAESIAMAHLGALRLARDNPAVVALLDTRLKLETEFHALKRRKSTMTSAAYYAELEMLLLAIARLQQAIDKATGWSSSDV